MGQELSLDDQEAEKGGDWGTEGGWTISLDSQETEGEWKLSLGGLKFSLDGQEAEAELSLILTL